MGTPPFLPGPPSGSDAAKNKKKLKKVLTNELIFAIISSEGEGREQGQNPRHKPPQ